MAFLKRGKGAKPWSYTVEKRDNDGKRRQEWVSGFRTKKDAQADYNRRFVHKEEGRFVQPSKITTGQYLREWCRNIEPPASRLTRNTWEQYRLMLDSYVLEPAVDVLRIADIPLQNLTEVHLERLYRDLLTRGARRKAGGLSPRTVRYVHVILSKAFTSAVKKRLLVVSPTAAVDAVPKQSRPKNDSWSQDELRQFLDHVSADRLFPLLHLTAVTGLRRCEVAGLPWSAVDFDRGRISVVQTCVMVKSKPVLQPATKTDRSRRSIAISKQTVSMLKAWKARQNEERLAAANWTDTGLVFTQEDGNGLHPEALSRWLDKKVAESGVTRITMHGFRRTYTTLALKAGVGVKVVSTRLGHTSTAFTLDVYSAVLDEMDDDAAATFDERVIDLPNAAKNR